MSRDKCEILDGKQVYCDDFKLMLEQAIGVDIATDCDGSNVKMGRVWAAFNRCPYCRERLSKED